MRDLYGGAWRFAVVGGLATAVHVAVFFLLQRTTSLSPTVATVPAFLCAVLLSYSLNFRWTFRADGSHRRRFPRFALLALAGAFANVGIMYVTTDLLGWAPALGLAVVVTVIPVLSFLGNRSWSFR